jgi:LPXTG-site transpeptidase (sortase) family protein
MGARWSRRVLLRAVLMAPAGLALPSIVASAAGAEPEATPQGITRGPKPVAIFIPEAQVDAPIETTQIVDGRMTDPSGPFVVGWYRESGRLTEPDNVVMSGHLDYWGVGRAVFYHLGALDEGDSITVLGEDEAEYAYEVEWVRRIRTIDSGPEAIREVVDTTAEERLTLITCGGAYDRKTGEYEERTVVRARPVAAQPSSPTGGSPMPV